MKTHVRQHMRRLPHSSSVTTVTDHDRRLSKQSCGGTMIRNPVRNPKTRPPLRPLYEKKLVATDGDFQLYEVKQPDGSSLWKIHDTTTGDDVRGNFVDPVYAKQEMAGESRRKKSVKTWFQEQSPAYQASVKAQEHYENTADTRYEKNLRGRKVLHEGQDADLVAETPTRREWVNRVSGEIERERLVKGRWEPA